MRPNPKPSRTFNSRIFVKITPAESPNHQVWSNKNRYRFDVSRIVKAGSVPSQQAARTFDGSVLSASPETEEEQGDCPLSQPQDIATVATFLAGDGFGLDHWRNLPFPWRLSLIRGASCSSLLSISSCVVRSCRQPRQICMSRTLKRLHSAPAKNDFRALSD
jgi:hypothetical protein